MQNSVRNSDYSFIYLFIDLFIYLFIDLFIYLFIYSFINSLIYLKELYFFQGDAINNPGKITDDDVN